MRARCAKAGADEKQHQQAGRHAAGNAGRSCHPLEEKQHLLPIHFAVVRDSIQGAVPDHTDWYTKIGFDTKHVLISTGYSAPNWQVIAVSIRCKDP